MDREIKIVINGGDSRELLFAQLFDIGRFAYNPGSPNDRPTFRVKTPDQTLEVHNDRIGVLHYGADTLHLLVNGIVAQSHPGAVWAIESGDLWAIQGRIAPKTSQDAWGEFGLPTNFEGEYDTRQRRGWIRVF